MAGIFEDPSSQALMALGLGLMGNEGPVGPAVARAGSGAMATLQAARRMQLEQQMHQQEMQMRAMQLAEAQRAFTEQQQVRDAARASQLGRTGVALSGGAGPTVQAGQVFDKLPANTDVFDEKMFANKVMGINPMLGLDLQAKIKAANAPIKIGADEQLRDPHTLALLAEGSGKTDQFEKTVAGIYGRGTPAYAAAMKDWITKNSTHQPQVSVNNYGTPLPITLPNGGGTGYLQPPTRPGAPSQVLTIPGTNTPAIKPPEAKDTSLSPPQAAQVAMLQQGMQNIADAEAKIFVKDPQTGGILRLNRALLSNVNSPVGSLGEDARTVRTALRNAVEARLRLESGAAVPQTEVDRMTDRLMPGPLDTVKSAQYKLSQLRDFFSSSLVLTKAAPGTVLSNRANANPVTAPGAPGAAPNLNPTGDLPSVNDLVLQYGKRGQ
jgi:hypothetical protein